MNAFVQHPRITRYAVLVILGLFVGLLEAYFRKGERTSEEVTPKYRFYVLLFGAIVLGDVVVEILSLPK